MDFVATRTGDRTTVRHADRWTITHTAGARLADITDPDGQLIATVKVVEIDCPQCKAYQLTLGGARDTKDSLSAALLEYAQTHSA
jgi:hypothetical protein